MKPAHQVLARLERNLQRQPQAPKRAAMRAALESLVGTYRLAYPPFRDRTTWDALGRTVQVSSLEQVAAAGARMEAGTLTDHDRAALAALPAGALLVLRLDAAGFLAAFKAAYDAV